MPRTARMIIPDEQAVYHVMSRTEMGQAKENSLTI